MKGVLGVRTREYILDSIDTVIDKVIPRKPGSFDSSTKSRSDQKGGVNLTGIKSSSSEDSETMADGSHEGRGTKQDATTNSA